MKESLKRIRLSVLEPSRNNLLCVVVEVVLHSVLVVVAVLRSVLVVVAVLRNVRPTVCLLRNRRRLVLMNRPSVLTICCLLLYVLRRFLKPNVLLHCG